MSRKQIVFDFDTHALEKAYPTQNWRHTYDLIKRHMQSNGFYWVEGSVYESYGDVKKVRAIKILEKFIDKQPWIIDCMRDCRISTISDQNDLTYLFRSDEREDAEQELDIEEDQEGWEQVEDEWEQEY